MLKKFRDGAIFGAGFAVSFILVSLIAAYIFDAVTEMTSTTTLNSSDQSNSFSNLEQPLQFLGSSAAMSGDNFSFSDPTTRPSGEGEIIGYVLADNMPIAGLRLALALSDNEHVWSQWAVSDELGEYSIKVPFGDYQIDGYRLDGSTANEVLPGYTTKPPFSISRAIINVAPGEPGVGTNLYFVKPITLSTIGVEYSVDEEIIVQWEPYPEAARYSIQVFKKRASRGGEYSNVFSYTSLPSTSNTFINLQDYTNDLTGGYYYIYRVSAFSESGEELSVSRDTDGYAFVIE